jgi:hypothetical protein
MNNQLALIHQRNTWLHFIGGYYSDTDKFVNEAIRSRISRRAPAQTVRGMQFGDRLVFLRYAGKENIFAFAEAEIVGISLDHEIAAEVGERLKEQGLAEYHEPGSGGEVAIERECGSYLLCGTWAVNCPLEDVMEIALQIAKERGETLFVMVNAELTKVYESDVYLQPAPKFSRGFTRASDEAQYFTDLPPMQTGEKTIFSIRNYQKADKPRRALPAGGSLPATA